ncbi:MAG: sigma-54-dependent transcriptional regulator [Nitrospiria bacterium]
MTENTTTILIVDDDEGIRDTLELILSKSYRTLAAESGDAALSLMREHDVQIVLLDVLLPDVNGLDLLQEIKNQFSDIEVVMISAVKEVETAVRAVKRGAYHYITKSFEYDEVLTLVDKVVEHQRDTRELMYLRSEMEQFLNADFIAGRSKKMQEIYALVHKIAPLPVTVLITGESGTGKQILARYIYKKSALANKPFVTVDLGAVPETLMESTLFGHEKGAFTGAYRQHIGKFEIANGGTLFLDEIGSLRYELQGKLLRVIQEGDVERVGGTRTNKVEIRLIAATSVNLYDAVQKGSFREDLFYRLYVIPIKLPALRERIGDLPQLIEFFLKRYNKRFNKNIEKVSQAAIETLSSYDWPGNIRELENLIERLVALIDGDTILKEHIPLEYRLTGLQEKQDGKLLEKAIEAFEQSLILRTLEKKHWNRRATAQALGVPLSTFKYKLKRLRLLEAIPTRGRGHR